MSSVYNKYQAIKDLKTFSARHFLSLSSIFNNKLYYYRIKRKEIKHKVKEKVYIVLIKISDEEEEELNVSFCSLFLLENIVKIAAAG